MFFFRLRNPQYYVHTSRFFFQRIIVYNMVHTILTKYYIIIINNCPLFYARARAYTHAHLRHARIYFYTVVHSISSAILEVRGVSK